MVMGYGHLNKAISYNLKKRNAFFAAVGMLPPLTTRVADALRLAGPGTAFKKINDAVRAGAWSV